VPAGPHTRTVEGDIAAVADDAAGVDGAGVLGCALANELTLTSAAAIKVMEIRGCFFMENFKME
jgi:hypothetical protein